MLTEYAHVVYAWPFRLYVWHTCGVLRSRSALHPPAACWCSSSVSYSHSDTSRSRSPASASHHTLHTPSSFPNSISRSSLQITLCLALAAEFNYFNHLLGLPAHALLGSVAHRAEPLLDRDVDTRLAVAPVHSRTRCRTAGASYQCGSASAAKLDDVLIAVPM